MKTQTLALLLSIIAGAAFAQEAANQTLITNVNVFDGVNEALIENANVLIDGNLIETVSTEPLAVAGGKVIDGGGRTLIPGLIDAHWHTTYAYTPQSTVISGDISEVAIRGALGAEKTLLRGFTTTRDTGGNPFSIKKLIDSGDLARAKMIHDLAALLPKAPDEKQ